MKKNTLFLLICILSIIILLEAIWSVNFISNANAEYQLNTLTESLLKTKIEPQQDKPSLFLETEENNISLWQNTTITVWAKPDIKPIQALDVIINFDNNLLQTTNFIPLVQLPSAEYWFNQTGSAFNNEEGKISFGLILPQQTINEPTPIAEIYFTAINPGTARLAFDFEPQKTIDTNVILENETSDSLFKTNNLDIMIENSAQ